MASSSSAFSSQFIVSSTQMTSTLNDTAFAMAILDHSEHGFTRLFHLTTDKFFEVVPFQGAIRELLKPKIFTSSPPPTHEITQLKKEVTDCTTQLNNTLRVLHGENSLRIKKHNLFKLLRSKIQLLEKKVVLTPESKNDYIVTMAINLENLLNTNSLAKKMDQLIAKIKTDIANANSIANVQQSLKEIENRLNEFNQSLEDPDLFSLVERSIDETNSEFIQRTPQLPSPQKDHHHESKEQCFFDSLARLLSVETKLSACTAIMRDQKGVFNIAINRLKSGSVEKFLPLLENKLKIVVDFIINDHLSLDDTLDNLKKHGGLIDISESENNSPTEDRLKKDLIKLKRLFNNKSSPLHHLLMDFINAETPFRVIIPQDFDDAEDNLLPGCVMKFKRIPPTSSSMHPMDLVLISSGNHYKPVYPTDSIHAEISLAAYIHHRAISLESVEQCTYIIGVTKLCCLNCHHQLENFNLNYRQQFQIQYRGTHGVAFPSDPHINIFGLSIVTPRTLAKSDLFPNDSQHTTPMTTPERGLSSPGTPNHGQKHGHSPASSASSPSSPESTSTTTSPKRKKLRDSNSNLRIMNGSSTIFQPRRRLFGDDPSDPVSSASASIAAMALNNSSGDV